MSIRRNKETDKAKIIDNLNDSIGSEFYEREEKSVYQKIREQPRLENKSFYNISNLIPNGMKDNQLFKHTTSKSIINLNENSKIHLSLNYTRNGNKNFI